MKILYACQTSLTGLAPLFTYCVNHYTGHRARCLSGPLGLFEWYARDSNKVPLYNVECREHARECLEWADVVHSWNYTTARSLRATEKLGRLPWFYMICGTVSGKLRHAWRDEDLKRVRTIVVAEGWHRSEAFERYEPFTLLPNLFAVYDNLHQPLDVHDRWRRFPSFAPSNRSRAQSNTKGYDHVAYELKDLGLDLIEGEPFERCMQRKALAWVGVDEVATPMMHHSGPEYLALGVPCVSRWDEVTERAWKEALGCDDVPFIPATPKTLRQVVLDALNEDRDAWAARSLDARRWAKRYLCPRETIARYVELYEKA